MIIIIIIKISKNYNGVAYDKEYTHEALDNENYDKRMMK